MEPSRQLPCRSGVIGLAIAGNPENDGRLWPWQEAAGHEIILNTDKHGRANEATTGGRSTPAKASKASANS